jgi:hypothetical protein
VIFYTAVAENGATRIVGTQAEARAINKDFQQVDIPTDKPGLMAILQDSFDTIFNLEQQIGGAGASVPAEGSDGSQEQVPDVASESPVSRQAEPSVRPAIQNDWTAAQIEDFILNRATVSQTENIFSCLGARFKELASSS